MVPSYAPDRSRIMKNWRLTRIHTDDGPPTDPRLWVDSVNAARGDGLAWSDPTAPSANDVVSDGGDPRTPAAVPVQPCVAFSDDPFGSLRSWSSAARAAGAAGGHGGGGGEEEALRAPFGGLDRSRTSRRDENGTAVPTSAHSRSLRRSPTPHGGHPADFPRYDTLPDGMILRTSPKDGTQEHLSVASTLKTFVAVLGACILLAVMIGGLLVLLPMMADSPAHEWQTDPEVTFVAFVVLLGASFAAALPTLHVTELRVAFASEHKDRRDRRVSVTTYRLPCCCRNEFEFAVRDVVGVGGDDPWIAMTVLVPGDEEPTVVLLDDGRRSADSLRKQVALWSDFFGIPATTTATGQAVETV